MALERARRRHARRPERARAADESRRAAKVVEPTGEGYRRWARDPSRADYPGVDTPEARVARMAEMAPVTGHTLEPATSVHDVAHLAGFGPSPLGGGHDAFQGVAEMVYDVDGLGEVDAMQELRFEDGTEGPILHVADDESIFDEGPGQDHIGMDWVRFDLDLGLDPGPAGEAFGGDPRPGLSVALAPAPAGGGFADLDPWSGDWTGWL